ncbi:hypothetical protein LTR86_000469 [Recurvomyces mirabilis]|nr:hypothetical protein LTR86_000469 [Recurvomyces mirabilis]
MNQQLQLLSSRGSIVPLLAGGGGNGAFNDPFEPYHGIDPFDLYDYDPYILAYYYQAGMIDGLSQDMYLNGGRSSGRRGRRRHNAPFLGGMNIFGGGYGGFGGLGGYAGLGGSGGLGGLGGLGGYGGYGSRTTRNGGWPVNPGYWIQIQESG